MTIQTIIFPRDKWSKACCVYWLGNHGFKFDKIDITKEFYSFRQEKTDSTGRYITYHGFRGMMLMKMI